MFPMMNVPPFIKRELEKLHEFLSPLLKKASTYRLWSLPLLLISALNLMTILFLTPTRGSDVPVIILYAAVGAFGMALSREAKIQRIEIQKMRMDYVIDRINKSDIASNYVKKEYIALIQKQPLLAVNHFIKFLEEENNANH